MILWTMQPLEIWDIINEKGYYRCDDSKSNMLEPEIGEKYKWLVRQMRKRIGPPPAGVTFPVWAWYKQNGNHKKPDLRSERWYYGPGKEKYTCIELEIADDQVLLSDFDAWCIILLNGLLCESEEEADRLDHFYESLMPKEQLLFRDENWQKVFDLTPLRNEYMKRGYWVQATFWELRKEMVRDVRFFTTAATKQQ